MRSEASVEIDRPIDEVFSLTNDHVAQWSIIVVEDEVLEEKPGRVGTTFRTVTEENGRKMEFAGVVTRYDPPRLSAVRMTGQMFGMDVEYHFEDLGGRTRVTQASVVKGKGFFRAFLLLCGWMMKRQNCKAQEQELASLKQFCETRAVSAAE